MMKKLQLFAEELMEILKEKIQDFLDKYYGKTYILDSRVKHIDKMRQKQELYSLKSGYTVELTDLPDIIGFRISVENENDVEELSELVNSLLSPSRAIDNFNKPRESGFKAFLYYFEDFELNTEIQIMTIRMKEWTNSTHKEHNNRKYGHQ